MNEHLVMSDVRKVASLAQALLTRRLRLLKDPLSERHVFTLLVVRRSSEMSWDALVMDVVDVLPPVRTQNETRK